MPTSASTPAKRFRIAFSFAGDKRAFVKEVADLLAKRFTDAAILYDKYHEAEFANADLAFDLPALYKHDADLIVAVFCPDYERKEWCGLEWRVIFSMIKEGTVKPIMLTRFEHADGKGLHGLAGFIDLDHKTAEQAATLILERLALNEGKPKDHYTKAAPTTGPTHRTTIPHNLPSLQPFFGRSEELKKIAEALDPEARTWGALIDGPGGMGKTSLAIRAAHACTPDQFQRIIFVSTKDREMDDDGVRSLGTFILPGFLEMLNELARELGLMDFGKTPDEDRVRLLLEALRPTRTLIILDNLESLPKLDRDQLFTFVKRLPQGCKAILTSRRRIGSSADTLVLEKLDQAAALETLAEVAKHNPLLEKTIEAERIALYTQTGGKPLLLRWVAGQLGRGSCRSIDDALHFLRSCPPDNDPLDFIFGDLARDFTVPESKVLCALNYFTSPASVKHLQALANRVTLSQSISAYLASSSLGKLRLPAAFTKEPDPAAHLSDSEIEAALRSLANRSLVVSDDEEKCYALVPLVADFLCKHRPEVVKETGDRLEQRAYALIVENGFQKYDRFPVLDAVWPSVAPALPLFLTGPNDRLQTVCDALDTFLDFTGRWDEWLSLSQQAETRAIAAGDLGKAGWRAYQAGYIHSLREQAYAVLACADRAAAHWAAAKAGDRERAIAIRLRGLGHQLKKDHAAAIVACREALDLDRSRTAESGDVAIGLNYLANAESLSGEFDAAGGHYREALRVARAVGHAESVAAFTGNLAGLALNRKDWPAAEALVREALPLAEAVHRQDLIASNNFRLAHALVRQGKATEAMPHAQIAVDIFTRLGHANLVNAQAILRECEEALAATNPPAA